MLLGVDVGGTFTDAVLLDGDRVITAKAPTTPADQSQGVLAAVEALGIGAEGTASIERFSHGMTVGTNALLERAGARTALIATRGFTDLLEIARQDRVSLYHLGEDRPPPLVPPELRIGVEERIGPDGVIEELTEDEISRVSEELGRLEPEAVAICLLFSYRDPSHERRLAERLRADHPQITISVSSEVLPRFREYERCSTTVIDAYLAPPLRRYLGRLRDRGKAGGLPEPTVMRSSGGLATLAEGMEGGAWSVLSGPAGGAVGAAIAARASGEEDVLGFDMGGTSCDVCVVESGSVHRTSGRLIGGRPIELPMVDIHTVGAGGGSIGWRDPGGALSVGPRSAGADPGPACYGRGGTEPTVTDANLLLGYLPPGGELAGGVRLDIEAAERAVGGLAQRVGLDVLQTAEGIIRLANDEMLRALRVVTVERGIDPRGFALLAFGGAGALHAAAIAAELEIDRVLCPRACGVLSALGLIASPRRRDLARTELVSEGALTKELIRERVAELAAEAAEGLGPDHELEVTYEIRYRGQSFELDIEAGPEPEPRELRDAFEQLHEGRYGYRDQDSAIELVGIRLAASSPSGQVSLAVPQSGAPRTSRRRARFGGEWVDAEVTSGALPPGFEAHGPWIAELPESTLVVPPGAAARVDEHGAVKVDLGSGR